MQILIVKIGAIGDAVMALPLLPAIRKKYPNAHITWVCGSQIVPLIRATQLVDQIAEINEKQLLTGSFFAKIFQLFYCWSRLAFRRFDLILTLHSDPRYRLLSRFSFCKDRRHWGKKRDRFYPIPGRYHAEETINLLHSNEGPHSNSIEYPTIDTPLRNNLGKPILLIAPGGAKNVLADDSLRRWPIQSYAKLIEELSLRNHRVVVVGSNTDRWILPFLPSSGFENWLGQLNLLELIGVMKSASLLITHDSGPLHLAKLAHCQTLALFGPTNPHEKTSPHEKIHVLWGGERLSCRPCYNGKTYAACKNNQCLGSLTPERVLEKALQLLQRGEISPDKHLELPVHFT